MKMASFAVGMSVGMLIVGICISTPANSLSADVGGELRSHQVTSTTQKSDREVTLADYGFEDGMPVPKENPPFRAGRFGYSIIIVSPTVIRVVAEPVYGGGVMLPSAEDFARALDRIDRKRLIKLAVPVTSTVGSERARYQEEGAEKEPGWTKERDGLSRTNELIVVVDDPRNPEKH